MNNLQHASQSVGSSYDDLYRLLTDGLEDEAALCIRQALDMAVEVKQEKPIQPRGTDAATTLKQLGVDPPTLQAALLSDLFYATSWTSPISSFILVKRSPTWYAMSIG